MNDADDQAIAARLADALRGLCPAGVTASARRITTRDARLLTAAEAAQAIGTVDKVRCQRGAARWAARRALGALGHGGAEILRAPSGEPVWPDGILGSLAHDDAFAVAVVARARGDLRALGVDVEPAEPLPLDIVDHVLQATDRRLIARADLPDRAVFCIKEAVYKAAFGLDQTFLDFPDIVLDGSRQTATTATGLRLHWRCAVNGRLIAVAWAAAP